MGKQVPQGMTREEAAEFFDHTDITDIWDQLEPATLEASKLKSVTFAIRLDPRTVKVIRALAEREHIGPTQLVRSWILDRLQLEAKMGALAEPTTSLPNHLEREIRERVLDAILEALPELNETALQGALQAAKK